MSAAFGNNSLILTYSKFLDSFGSGDGTVNLQTPITLPSNPARYLQLIQANFSKYIANVLSITQPFAYNNTRIRWTTDGGAHWYNIDLPTGNYTLATIQDAIVAATYTIHTNSGDPAIFLAANLATGKTYVVLDNRKCNVGGYQLGIDFGSTASADIAEFLGFNPASATFIGNNVYSAPNPAQLNLTGDSVSIQLGGFGALSVSNGGISTELANVPMIAYSPTANEFVYPLVPFEKPLILLQQVPQTISYYSVAFKGTRKRKGIPWPIFWVEGAINLTFQLIFP